MQLIKKAQCSKVRKRLNPLFRLEISKDINLKLQKVISLKVN